MCQLLGSGMKDNEEIWAAENTGLVSQYIRSKPHCRMGTSAEGFQNICERPMPKVSSLALPKGSMANVGILRETGSSDPQRPTVPI